MPPTGTGTTADSMMRSRRRWQVGAALAVPALVAFGWYLDKTIAAELKTVVGEGLQSFLAHKVETLEEWIEEELKVAKIVAADPVIHDAIVSAVKAYDEIGANPVELLANPDRNHLSELLQTRMEAWGYPGAAVIARDGTVLTALRREYVGSKFFLTEPEIKRVVDMVMSGTSVFAGPLLSPVPVAEELGQRATQQPVMFTAVPVQSSDGKVVAMFGFRIPLAQDFTRILHRGQMGESGETYAFNMEGLLLSASRFDKQLRRIGLLPRQDPDPRSILRVKILDPGVNLVQGEDPALPPEEQELTEMARSAVRGETGFNVDGYRDYRGVTVVGAWTWLPHRGFGVASEVDRDEAYRPVLTLQAWFRTVLGLLALAVLGLLFYSRFMWVLRGRIQHTTRQLQKLGQYTLEEKLGEGGMGQVFRARHALLRRPTALKLLKPERTRTVDAMRFEREVQLTSMLTHPNTIAIYDYGRTPEGIFYYVMEYLNGLALHRVVDKTGPLLPARVIHLLLQACGSLGEAHRDGLIHRDIKPANLMVCERGGVFDVVKVVDFGLVRDLQKREGATLTDPNAVAGTPQYLSPEGIRSASEVDARSDLYSLGCVAYYLLSGREVVQRDGSLGWVDQILHETPDPPSSVIAGAVPQDLEKAVMACLEKSPDDRPQSAAELARLLAACGDAGDWTQAHARHWWEAHGPKEKPPTSDESTLVKKTLSVVVDVAAR
jgi:serine/threonine protein kinase